ncbi:unnamed protein product [Echinostoma caproni]|uniref:Uncharacterized protein n=1 Tax=Echinostoma caproni TaxID=27848 RepID=A0A3P8FMU1_9TREM|nr:unnamed protein product [Echinostoma caproni]
MGTTPDYCILPLCSGFVWFGRDEGLGSSPAVDNLAPEMVVGHAVSTVLTTYVRVPDQVVDYTPCLTYKVF